MDPSLPVRRCRRSRFPNRPRPSSDGRTRTPDGCATRRADEPVRPVDPAAAHDLIRAAIDATADDQLVVGLDLSKRRQILNSYGIEMAAATEATPQNAAADRQRHRFSCRGEGRTSPPRPFRTGRRRTRSGHRRRHRRGGRGDARRRSAPTPRTSSSSRWRRRASTYGSAASTTIASARSSPSASAAPRPTRSTIAPADWPPCHRPRP